jgi:hypothetical protein
MDGEEQFHEQNKDFKFVFSPGNYVRLRDQIKSELNTYNNNWRVFFYEDLIENPLAVVNNILNCINPPLIKTKLNYRKEDIVENYWELKSIEECANFDQYRNV